MTKILAAVTLVLLVLTAGCGFSIYFGGESFQEAIKGHIILGILTLISLAMLVVNIFRT